GRWTARANLTQLLSTRRARPSAGASGWLTGSTSINGEESSRHSWLSNKSAGWRRRRRDNMPRFSARRGLRLSGHRMVERENWKTGNMEPTQIKQQITDLTERTEALRRYL